MTAHARQFLSASTRRGRDVLEDDDELAAAKLPARAPGKRSDEDELGLPARDPGKRSRAGDGTAAMSAAHAVAFADWMTRAHRIDRRAEASIADEAGALSAAFEFLADARGGQALPGELRQRLERELGVGLAAVRVHTDDQAAAAAAALGARAFTIGDDIYFAAGAYDPTGEAGQALIAHEVAHVAQHRLGTAPTAPTARKLSRPDDGHERDAERFRRGSRPRARPDPATIRRGWSSMPAAPAAASSCRSSPTSRSTSARRSTSSRLTPARPPSLPARRCRQRPSWCRTW